jgi:hypothetical protein
MRAKEFIIEGKKTLRNTNPCWKGYHPVGTKKKNGRTVPNCVPGKTDEAINAAQQAAIAVNMKKHHKKPKSLDEELEEQFDIIEEMINYIAEYHGVDSDVVWEDFDEIDDEDLLSEAEAWQTSKGKNKNGGLNKKGVSSYRRSHPGSKLQTAVTTKPSKLKKGSKASKRRKSFCARMKGMKKHRTGAKTKRDPNSRINKSLRKWHCE